MRNNRKSAPTAELPLPPMLRAGSITVSYTPPPVYHQAATPQDVANLCEYMLVPDDFAVQNLYAFFTNSHGGLIHFRHLGRGSSSGVLVDVRSIVAIGAQLNTCSLSLVHTMPHTEWPAINEASQRSLAHLQEALHICQFQLHCYLTVTRDVLNVFHYTNELTTESRLEYESLFFTKHNPHRMAGYIIG